MDTITHGIAGALIGKGFFSEKHGRIASFALTLGAVFPDSDVTAEIFSRDPMSLLKYHRGITHSFIGMPFFAVGLAALTRWYTRRRGMDCPSSSVLTAIYAIGIASHILLDGLTSFGTRMWEPISFTRVAWDWIFIIDLTFTAILLLPQVAAWVYRKREAASPRALWMWALFSLCGAAIFALGRFVRAPFPWQVVAVASAVLAALFFLPAWRGWGFGVRRASWCRAGTWLALGYLMACGLAHHEAVARVAKFAADNRLPVENVAAIPAPPSILNWHGLARTADGIYDARLNLASPAPPAFEFVAHSELNRYIETAFELPTVQTYLGFARFPVVKYYRQGDENVVELNDMRFRGLPHRSPRPFTFMVVLDADGNVIRQGWTLE